MHQIPILDKNVYEVQTVAYGLWMFAQLQENTKN